MSRVSIGFAGVAMVLATAPVFAQVVINEVRYDTVVEDTDNFTEIAGPGGTSLDGYQIVHINGFDNTEYFMVDLTGQTIPGDGFFVVGGAQVPNVDLPFGTFPDDYWLQNGPDQVVLRLNGVDVDSLCYGGDSGGILTTCEGNPTPPIIEGNSLSRDESSTDTDDNETDFIVVPTGQETPGEPFAGVCPLVENLASESNCDTNDALLTWTLPAGADYTMIEVFRDTDLIATLPADATSATDPGLAPGVYEFEVRATCTNGLAGGAFSSLVHCQGGADPNLIISEIVMGNLAANKPKWVELTNCGLETIDMTLYSVGNFNNGALTLGGGASTALTGELGPGDSYIFEYDSDTESVFEDIYGFPGDAFAGGGFINGNDVVALFFGPASTDAQGNLNGDIIDVYGVRGVEFDQGSGDEPWDYFHGYAQRNPGAPQSPVFDESQWFISGVGALEGPDMGVEDDDIMLLQDLTNPGDHNCGGTQAFVRADCDGNAQFNGIPDGLMALNFQFVPGTPAPPCLAACDADGDRAFNGLVDGLTILNFAFVPGTPPPPAPYPDCGEDANGVLVLGCDDHACP